MAETFYGRGPYFVKVRRAFRSPTLREAFATAVSNGWGFRVSGSTHVLLTNGKTAVQISVTEPDSSRSVLNQIAIMRRKGALGEMSE